eukprot:6368501-Amphidinium_carterae.1
MENKHEKGVLAMSGRCKMLIEQYARSTRYRVSLQVALRGSHIEAAMLLLSLWMIQSSFGNCLETRAWSESCRRGKDKSCS